MEDELLKAEELGILMEAAEVIKNEVENKDHTDEELEALEEELEEVVDEA